MFDSNEAGSVFDTETGKSRRGSSGWYTRLAEEEHGFLGLKNMSSVEFYYIMEEAVGDLVDSLHNKEGAVVADVIVSIMSALMDEKKVDNSRFRSVLEEHEIIAINSAATFWYSKFLDYLKSQPLYTHKSKDEKIAFLKSLIDEDLAKNIAVLHEILAKEK